MTAAQALVLHPASRSQLWDPHSWLFHKSVPQRKISSDPTLQILPNTSTNIDSGTHIEFKGRDPKGSTPSVQPMGSACQSQQASAFTRTGLAPPDGWLDLLFNLCVGKERKQKHGFISVHLQIQWFTCVFQS